MDYRGDATILVWIAQFIFFFLVQCAVVGRKFWLPLGLKALLCAGRENFATIFRHKDKVFDSDP